MSSDVSILLSSLRCLLTFSFIAGSAQSGVLKSIRSQNVYSIRPWCSRVHKIKKSSSSEALHPYCSRDRSVLSVVRLQPPPTHLLISSVGFSAGAAKNSLAQIALTVDDGEDEQHEA